MNKRIEMSKKVGVTIGKLETKEIKDENMSEFIKELCKTCNLNIVFIADYLDRHMKIYGVELGLKGIQETLSKYGLEYDLDKM